MGAVVRLVSGESRSTPHPSLTGRTCCSAPRTGGGKTAKPFWIGGDYSCLWAASCKLQATSWSAFTCSL